MSGAVQLSPADFPGYAAAVARENFVRAAACLGLTETVCGIEVEPLTSRKVRLLALVNSPFLLRGVTADQICHKPDVDLDILAFLWIVSPKYAPGNTRKRDKFFKRHRALLNARLFDLVSEILNYIEDAYLDAPEPDNDPKSYFAFEVSIVTSLHRTYGLPLDFWETHWLRAWVRRFTGKPSPLDVPLKIYWQLQKAERAAADPRASLSNNSDRLLADGLAAMNARDRRLREYEKELMATPSPTFTGTQPPPDLSGSEYGL